jgi:Asp-tRNA(Asn)/Glu-tRNA(Gln) amidotransferase A subunit family amidase
MSEALTWMPAWQIRELIGKGEVSPVEVTEHFLGRIEELNPTLKAFATLDAVGARAQAKQAEDAVLAGQTLGTLHGIPISAKEHIPIAGLPTQELFGPNVTIAVRDELGIARLRGAGAIVIGTNTQMGTAGGATRLPDDAGAFSAFNWEREARNPWDPSRVPGWSSAGPAASAAARLVPIAIGSDGGGSTRLPGAYSGVVGVHPTSNLIPSVDYTGLRRTPMLTIGPLCRDVVDAAIALQAMAGPDGRDFLCQQIDPPDYLEQIAAGAAGLRLAWTDDYGFTDMYAQEESPRIIAAVRDAAAGFSSLGASVETTTVVWEDFFPGVTATQLASAGKTDPATWAEALDTRGRNWQRCRDVLASHDLLLSVTSQILPKKVEDWDAAWTTDGARYPHGTFAPVYTSHTFMFNWLGFPAVSLPCGFLDGLPLGLQIVGLPGREDLILRAANAYQQAFPCLDHPPVS